MMDRELGFDLYTLRLLFLVVLTVTVCSCTIFAANGFYKILHYEVLQGIPDWQGFVLWVSCSYIGLYTGIRLVGRTGWTAIAETVDKAANGEPNIFAELGASDLHDFDNFGPL
jgi:hypothetical protein